MSKRKEVTGDVRDKLEITPLGAGSEVGRSCVYMSYKGKNVLFDCGIHPAYSGIASLPYFDEIDPATIDVLLVTHFHLDHSASLPYFLQKTNFKGRVFMTHATKAVYNLLLQDFVKVSKVAVDDTLFDENDIRESLKKIETIDFHQVQEVTGIKFWCYTAGHVLGAAMFMVDIAGVRVLYTGDYSREEDRHLRAAELPPFSPELCIIESTYGVQQHERREVRERRFSDLVSQTVLGGGRVLIPAFALGRAQELLLILDEYWQAHPELHHVPILYASPLARKCMAVYQTYIGAMNDRIKKQSQQSNPFQFKHISDLRSIEHFEDAGPAVVMASPGGLQSGLSRQLFDRWCQDRKNACIIPGYVVEGTLAKTILSEPKDVTLANGLSVPLRMGVHYISFSAHADYVQTSEFLEELRPPNIVLVHGEATEMGRLKTKLLEKMNNRHTDSGGGGGERGTSVFTPKNCQTVELFFKGEKVAKAVGRLAEATPADNAPVSGLLVKKGFAYQLVAPEDLPVYTQLATGSVMQRQAVPFAGGAATWHVLRRRLEQTFESVEESAETASAPPTLTVHEAVTVRMESSEVALLQWVSDPVSDMVADSVVALLLQFSPRRAPAEDGGGEAKGPGGISQPLALTAAADADRSEEELEAERFQTMLAILANIFGEGQVAADEGERLIRVAFDGTDATVDFGRQSVECPDERLKKRISVALQRARMALYPIPRGQKKGKQHAPKKAAEPLLLEKAA
eukprot:jgi/Mesen1/2972/ME000176S02013